MPACLHHEMKLLALIDEQLVFHCLLSISDRNMTANLAKSINW